MYGYSYRITPLFGGALRVSNAMDSVIPIDLGVKLCESILRQAVRAMTVYLSITYDL